MVRDLTRGKIVVSSGRTYIDIDGLASAVAYRELLRLEGKAAEAVLTAGLSASVTAKIKSWDLGIKTKPLGDSGGFVVVDVSEPDHFEEFVDLKKIIEIYDHHFGFEDYWENRLGNRAKIEPVGSCATLIWEEYRKRDFGAGVSPLSANLLFTAIISNTLNFNSSVVTGRDKKALRQLKRKTDLPLNWIEMYFTEVEEAVFKSPVRAIKGDTKVQKIGKRVFVIGQLELWKAREFLMANRTEISSVLADFGGDFWFYTSPSIAEGRNYLYTEGVEIKRLLERFIGARFRGSVGVTDRLWLRKEILKKLMESKDEF